MKKPSKEDISRACLIAYFVLFAVSPLILGDNTGWCIAICFALVPSLVLGSQKQRALACVFVVFTLYLAMSSIQDHGTMAPARLKSQLIQCQSELRALKKKLEQKSHSESIQTDAESRR